MDSKHQYVIALFNAIASLRLMFERIIFNLEFSYHLVNITYPSLFQQRMKLNTYFRLTSKLAMFLADEGGKRLPRTKVLFILGKEI